MSTAPLDPLGRQLNVAARATRGLLDATLAEAGTTFSSWAVIAALYEHGPAIQKELGARLGMIGASVVERVDQLERAGLAQRSTPPSDRRASLVTLTAAGTALYGEVAARMRATEAALVAGLGADELETTRRVLGHVAERARALRAPKGAA
jgi:DNA-binding MarR family transcriptional regulator